MSRTLDRLRTRERSAVRVATNALQTLTFGALNSAGRPRPSAIQSPATADAQPDS